MNINDLPNEILSNIVKCFTINDLSNFSRTNKRFYSIAQDEWKRRMAPFPAHIQTHFQNQLVLSEMQLGDEGVHHFNLKSKTPEVYFMDYLNAFTQQIRDLVAFEAAMENRQEEHRIGFGPRQILTGGPFGQNLFDPNDADTFLAIQEQMNILKAWLALPEKTKLQEFGQTHQGYEALMRLLAEGNIFTLAYGYNFFHYALYLAHKNIVMTLVEHGADIQEIDQHIGDNALAILFFNHNRPHAPHGSQIEADMTRFLLGRGVYPDCSRYNTALLHAIQYMTPGMVEAMLMFGADPNFWDEVEESYPLRSAVQFDNPEKVALLLKYGADINEFYDGDGKGTNLHRAISDNRVNVIPTLLGDSRLNLDLLDGDDQTPLRLARALNLPEIVQLIENEIQKRAMPARILQEQIHNSEIDEIMRLQESLKLSNGSSSSSSSTYCNSYKHPRSNNDDDEDLNERPSQCARIS